jgi:hypothetical protein
MPRLKLKRSNHHVPIDRDVYTVIRSMHSVNELATTELSNIKHNVETSKTKRMLARIKSIAKKLKALSRSPRGMATMMIIVSIAVGGLSGMMCAKMASQSTSTVDVEAIKKEVIARGFPDIFSSFLGVVKNLRNSASSYVVEVYQSVLDQIKSSLDYFIKMSVVGTVCSFIPSLPFKPAPNMNKQLPLPLNALLRIAATDNPHPSLRRIVESSMNNSRTRRGPVPTQATSILFIVPQMFSPTIPQKVVRVGSGRLKIPCTECWTLMYALRDDLRSTSPPDSVHVYDPIKGDSSAFHHYVGQKISLHGNGIFIASLDDLDNPAELLGMLHKDGEVGYKDRQNGPRLRFKLGTSTFIFFASGSPKVASCDPNNYACIEKQVIYRGQKPVPHLWEPIFARIIQFLVTKKK